MEYSSVASSTCGFQGSPARLGELKHCQREIAEPGQPLRHAPEVRQHVLGVLQLDAQAPRRAERAGRRGGTWPVGGSRIPPAITARTIDASPRSAVEIRMLSRPAEHGPGQPGRSEGHRQLEPDRGMDHGRDRHRDRGTPPCRAPAWSPRRRSRTNRGPAPPGGPGPSPRTGGSCRYCPPWPRERGRRPPSPPLGPNSGQTAPASRSTARQVLKKVSTKTKNRPAGRPRGREIASSRASEPRWGLNSSSDRTNGSLRVEVRVLPV